MYHSITTGNILGPLEYSRPWSFHWRKSKIELKRKMFEFWTNGEILTKFFSIRTILPANLYLGHTKSDASDLIALEKYFLDLHWLEKVDSQNGKVYRFRQSICLENKELWFPL